MSQFYTKDQTDELAGFIGRNVRDSVKALEETDLNLLNKINNLPTIVTFNVDITSGILYMETRADYVGVTFSIKNDNLEVSM